MSGSQDSKSEAQGVVATASDQAADSPPSAKSSCTGASSSPSSTAATSPAREAAIGPKAREELAGIPGGQELLDQHDDPRTPEPKAQELRQGAAVALAKNRSGDPGNQVEHIGRKVTNSKGKEITEIDVETKTEQIELKGGDFSERSSLNKKQNTALQRKKTQAAKDGKTPVYQFEKDKVNPELKQKLEKKGVEVREEDFPMDELAE